MPGKDKTGMVAGKTGPEGNAPPPEATDVKQGRTGAESTPTDPQSVLKASDLYSLYQTKEGAPTVVALRGLSLELFRGEMVAIVGPSGSGKSTLLRVLGGLQFPSAGTVFYGTLNLVTVPEKDRAAIRRKTVGYVFQEGNLLPTVSAFGNIVQTQRFNGVSRDGARKRAEELLQLLGVGSRMHALPERMSGGERQRVAIARALANSPTLLLMDEPTGNLDHQNAEHVMETIKEIQSRLKTTCLIVTHSNDIASYADRTLELRDGKIVGEHDKGVDFKKMETSRHVVIGRDGTLALPPEMIKAIEPFGLRWTVRFEPGKDGASPTLVWTPAAKADSESKPTSGESKCQVCGGVIPAGKISCPHCGAKAG